MKIGAEITVIHNGTFRNAVFCGLTPTGRATVWFRDDRSRRHVEVKSIKRRTRPPKVCADAELCVSVKRVFAEFREAAGRPPTEDELRAWLPGAGAGMRAGAKGRAGAGTGPGVVELAKRMGLEFGE